MGQLDKKNEENYEAYFLLKKMSDGENKKKKISLKKQKSYFLPVLTFQTHYLHH